MELTQEQKDIIQSIYTDDKVIKVNAYAGSGKTSTIIELVKEIKSHSITPKILYTVFNKSMKVEAENKFKEAGIKVDCLTVHGLALRKYIRNCYNFKQVISSLFSDDYIKVSSAVKQTMHSWINFGHVKELFEIYCKYTYDMDDFIDLLVENKGYHKDLKEGVTSAELKTFQEYYNLLLSKGLVTHGMYLKEYSSNYQDIISDWDYVFIDEAQDLNVHMSSIISRMKYKKIWYFGDTYQQIYGWNNAVNAMENVEGKEYILSTSFRLNNENTELANNLLSALHTSFRDKTNIINAVDQTEIKNDKQITYLFRTNVMMFAKAIELVCSDEGKYKVHFLDVVGGENSDSFDTTFGELLYFYHKLMGENKEFAKLFKIPKYNSKVDNIVKQFKKSNSESLFSYCCTNESILDNGLDKYFDLFVAYRKCIVDILIKMKESENIENPDKEYWLCTAHRSKGLEWEYVIIAKDRWTFGTDDDKNLAYVASTRATKKLDYDNLVLSLISQGQYVKLPDPYIQRLKNLVGTEEFSEELQAIYNFYSKHSEDEEVDEEIEELKEIDEEIDEFVGLY